MAKNLTRLVEALAAASVPNEGVWEDDAGNVHAHVTPANQAAADTVIAGMDWSQAAETAWFTSSEHAALVSLLSAFGPREVRLLRALLLIILDEFNLHADKMNAILTAIDGGSTLAQVKSNIAAIADYPQRTKANLISALTNKINAGSADS